MAANLSDTRRITFVGRKGGVGKTTCTVTFADDLAYRHGLTCLVIDMDPQANASKWLGVESPERTISDAMYSAHIDGALDDVIVETEWERVFLAPAEEALASREADRTASPELRLRRLLRTADLSWCDVVLIDAPPSLGPLLLNALNASTDAYVVTDAERGGLDGIARMLQTVQVIGEDANPGLQVTGLLMNDFDARIREHEARWQELAELYPDQPKFKLPRRASVATAFGASVPPRAVSGAASFVYAARDAVDGLMKEVAA